ncbi:hypothetical protein Daus18300_009024 [Diaporthe australafricana]|uniref:Protein kinase domain-containing protein n=1 Tax=Diaporthe australafricana TaxID=127596 RepID=A0ABR3WFX5_9PEZI
MQFQVYTPFLTDIYSGKDREIVTFPEEVSMPWIRKTRLGEHILGEVSYVEEIEIHPGNHDLAENIEKCFALKTFEDRLAPGLSQKRFKQEVKANLEALKHDRIVRLLTAFSYRERFYLLLPFANEGSLEKLWTSYIPDGIVPESTDDIVPESTDGIVPESTEARVADWYSDKWLLGECLGITEALVATHGLINDSAEDQNGLLHADIKPENILCFRESSLGTSSIALRLADFGEAKRLEADVALKSSNLAHIMTYRPPEHSTDSRITLKYDIWSLGCLFLEFVTWAILGQDGIESFRKTREDEEKDPAVNENHDQLIEDIFFKAVKQNSAPLLLKRLKLGRGKETKVKCWLWILKSVQGLEKYETSSKTC